MGQTMLKHNSSTSNSKKTLLFLLKLVAAIVILIGYLNHILPQYSLDYNASLLDKTARLESIEGPKLVLIGNSNLSFGINSSLLETLTDMPVVNMGLHGGAGNAFHEEMAKLNVHPGDIYVLCHASYHDDNKIQTPMVAWSAIENHPKLWRLLRPCDIEDMARAFPVYLKRCLGLYASGTGNLDKDGVYARSAFNEYGDVALLREENQYVFEGSVIPPQIGDVTIERINALNDFLSEKGASLVVAGYPIGNGPETAPALEFVDFQKELAEKLDCPVISNFTNYMFDYGYFYDTKYHMTSSGADLRTIQLASDLERWLETGNEADPQADSYTDIIADVDLSRIKDLRSYLDALAAAKDRYSILISADEETMASLDDGIKERLKFLGLSAQWQHGSGDSYAAVIEQCTVLYENSTHETLAVFDTLDDRRMTYSVSNTGTEYGNRCTIALNWKEYNAYTKSINLVVYSNETHRILDAVVFDASRPELSVTRQTDAFSSEIP